MPDFYYQVKGKRDDSWSGSWAFPPLFSGKVTADNKVKAKAIIENDYGRSFPLRVLKKDLADHHFLMSIKEIKEDDKHTLSLFDENICKKCSASFKRIDLYNDHNERYKGTEFCSQDCSNVYRDENRVYTNESFIDNGKPVIYQIKNIQTGMVYIGKTTQVFTLRWYQHFFQGGNCKFHQAIKNSKAEDWQFSVVETVTVPVGESKSDYVEKRESHWINKMDSVNDGYNSISVKGRVTHV